MRLYPYPTHAHRRTCCRRNKNWTPRTRRSWPNANRTLPTPKPSSRTRRGRGSGRGKKWCGVDCLGQATANKSSSIKAKGLVSSGGATEGSKRGVAAAAVGVALIRSGQAISRWVYVVLRAKQQQTKSDNIANYWPTKHRADSEGAGSGGGSGGAYFFVSSPFVLLIQ